MFEHKRMMSVSSHLLLLLTLLACLIDIILSADCGSQGSKSNCELVSGCSWFDNKCQCATDVKVDIIFAIDRSGSIGKTEFQEAKAWLSDFVQTGLPPDPRIGFVYFASDVDASDINLHVWDIDTLVSYIGNMGYTGGSTHTELALDASITEYKTDGIDSRQKLVLMITDGVPNCGGCDVCSRSSTLRAMNIRVIILGVGSGLTEKYVECLLLDPTSDYIPVNSYNYDDFQKIMPALQKLTCPVSYNMKITEVKPQTDTNAAFGSKFVEVWNIGSTVNGADLQFNGFVTGTLPNTVSVKQSHYMVLYEIDSTFKNVTCVNCGCNPNFIAPYTQLQSIGYFCNDSLYYPCSPDSEYCSFDSNMDKTNWNQSIYDISDNAHQLIDSVDTSQNTPWPVILDGWTMKLKAIGFDNDAGNNWEQSCYNTGTPGDPPIQCPHQHCSYTTCQLNGARTASINPSTGYCSCPTTYYPTGCTCKSVPNPSNCMAVRVKQDVSTWYTLYSWDRVDYDQDIQYELMYRTDGGSDTTVTSYGLIKTVLNYDWKNRGISMSAGTLRSFITINDKNYYSESAECLPITQNPTTEPTPSPSNSTTPAPTNIPTKSPTNNPTAATSNPSLSPTKTPSNNPSTYPSNPSTSPTTVNPSSSPTKTPTQSPLHVLPWLFIGGGICEINRCQCGISSLVKDKACCMEDENNCTLYSRQFVFTEEPQFITVQSYDPFGKSYAAPFDTIGYYKFEYLGWQNISDTYDSDDGGDGGDGDNDDGDNDNDESQDNIPSHCKGKNNEKKGSSPVIISPMNGSFVFNKEDASSTQSITFNMIATGEVDECKGDAIFRLTLLTCNSSYFLNGNWSHCQIVYPNQYILYIQQPVAAAELSWFEKEIKPILWWLIAAMAVILLIIAFLVYKFWYKTKIKGKAIAGKENEMQQLIEEEEGGIGTTSDNININGKEEIPKNERANVMIEKFDERQEYGQNQGVNFNNNYQAGYKPPAFN